MSEFQFYVIGLLSLILIFSWVDAREHRKLMNKIIEHTENTRGLVRELNKKVFDYRDANGVYIRQISENTGSVVIKLDALNDKMSGFKKVASNFKWGLNKQ